MGRINYAIRLIIRILFVVMCFAVTFLFTAIGNYRTDEIQMTASAEQPFCEITVKNGATAQCSVENGMIVLEIAQSSGEYDDIVLTLKTAPLKYDTAYLESVMGAKPEYAGYIEDMKTGPWSANINYRLTGDSVLTKDDKSFSLKYNDGVFTDSLSSKAANTNNSSDELLVSENDEFTLDIIMGTESAGPLPDGKYYLFAELNISGLYGESNPGLSLIESIPGFLNIAVDALKTVEITSIFNVSSWLTFYFVMVIFGCLFFVYPDIRAAFRIATAGKSNVRKVTYYVYVNGCYTGEAGEYTGTAAFSLFGFILTYFFMLITVPLRLAAQILNGFIRIICGDKYGNSDPLFSNILGSIGVYAVLAAIIGLLKASMSNGNYTVTAILGGIGILLLIVANIITKRQENKM